MYREEVDLYNTSSCRKQEVREVRLGGTYKGYMQGRS